VQAARAAGLAGGVLCIDTLAASAPGMDENTSADMGEVIAGLKALQAELGGLVLAVHHTGKDATKGLRGHSSLLGALDAAIEVTRTDDRREWRTAKSKDGSDGDAHPFRLEVVELETDEDGEPVTSCVVAPEERTADALRRVKLPQGGNQRIVYDALRDLLREARRFGMAGAPPTRPCIELEEAIEKARDRLACASDRKTERTRQAITGLVNSGALALREGWIWLA
ncbi:helicase RepA family protein, partial [Thauera aromatica]|uniref:AAA family ATPase n=1 Tax=Thauera aromatica TaxID=59405 RepID=UPI001FFCA849